MHYRFAYSIGFHPWEDAATDPQFLTKFSELITREEQNRPDVPGRALDLGTGSGVWGIELAKRGWDVTGIDFIKKALDRAEERVQEAGVKVDLIQGDVTSLTTASVGSGFQLVLDTGTFHDFEPDQQAAMGHGIDAIASADATILLLAWPRRRRPLIRGVTRTEIETAFSGWEITDVEPSHFHLPKPLQLILRPDEHWYRLRRVQNDKLTAK